MDLPPNNPTWQRACGAKILQVTWMIIPSKIKASKRGRRRPQAAKQWFWSDLDLCFQDRLMLNGVDIKMRLVRSKDTFSLMGDGGVKIKDVTLHVRKVKVHPSVQLNHIKGLERMMAKYPMCRVETKVFFPSPEVMWCRGKSVFWQPGNFSFSSSLFSWHS